MIPFSDPPLGDSSAAELEIFASLQEKYSEASRAVGFVIHLGKELRDTGFQEIITEIYPGVRDSLQGLCHPRVLMGLATLMWFIKKVRDDKECFISIP
jgi:hypothetical protein